MNLIKDILEYANRKYYPFIWKIEGPYLFISNKGFENNKEDGIAWFPSFNLLNSTLQKNKGITDYINILEDFKRSIDVQMDWYICEPEVRGLPVCKIPVEFTEEFEKILKPLREEYQNRNK